MASAGAIGGGYSSQGGYNGGGSHFAQGGAQAAGLLRGQFGGGQLGGGLGGGAAGFAAGTGQVRKFVSVHVGQDEPVAQQNKVIRAGGPADTHYNIIFVKAPSYGNQQNTEVILPEAPRQKTIVYVLTRRPQNGNDVQIRGPAPTQPAKPEVFFIRYKNDGEDQGVGPIDNGLAGQGPIGPIGVNAGPISGHAGGLGSSYGAPPATGHGPY